MGGESVTTGWWPKTVVALREGYSLERFGRDVVAGLTVGVIALPLAMAFGIASIPAEVAAAAGISPPAVGLVTAIVAGFLISLLGGSRVQIGGPTGAFIVVIYGVASRHGYDGLIAATVLAGLFVLLFGLVRLGAVIRYVPYPVTTGFTTGIAVIIATSQVKDFFGLEMGSVPAEFVEKWRAFAENASSWQPQTAAVAAGSLVLLAVLRTKAPRIPASLVVVVLAAIVVGVAGLPVETIGSRFGGIPRELPSLNVPAFDLELVRELIPDALAIALLISIESLLSAVVADGMTGYRHNADVELVGQGVANVAAALFGGIPATGAIARTAANVKAGAQTPIAGMVHAVTLLGIVVVLAPLASAIPLASLAAVLVLVAWNMSEVDHFTRMFRAPRSDAAVMVTTFLLTVFLDLTVAVGVGMVLASLLFMKRMADVAEIGALTAVGGGAEEEEGVASGREVPAGVEVYEIGGPFFFGVADRLKAALSRVERPPRVLILRMRRVPAVDATGLHALRELHLRCRRDGTLLVLSGVQPFPRRVFVRAGFSSELGEENLCADIDAALARARVLVGA
jgi:SulP family sulfate permease